MTDYPKGKRVTGPQAPQRVAPRDVDGNVGLNTDRDGWPQMPPPKAAPMPLERIAAAKGLPLLKPERRQERETGHPTGNVPALTQFPGHGRVQSPLKGVHLIEESAIAMSNRMAVYHGYGGPKGGHPDGDYVAPDGHRSRTLPEHLAWLKEHTVMTPLKDPRSGETFSDPSALLAQQVAFRHKKRVGGFAPARSTK